MAENRFSVLFPATNMLALTGCAKRVSCDRLTRCGMFDAHGRELLFERMRNVLQHLFTLYGCNMQLFQLHTLPSVT